VNRENKRIKKAPRDEDVFPIFEGES